MFLFLTVKDDFNRAFRKAKAGQIFDKILNRKQNLLSFQDIIELISTKNQTYKGFYSVELENIIGSEGRVNDFDRNFYPLKSSIRSRWESIAIAYYNYINLPPIKLYKVGDVFFVRDGNHRVSVAKSRHLEFIDSEVIEIKTDYRITKYSTKEDLMLQYKSCEEDRFCKQEISNESFDCCEHEKCC